MPHRHPRGLRGLARHAHSPVRARPRRCRHRLLGRRRRDQHPDRPAGRGALARLRLRHLRALPDRLGNAVPEAAEHRLLGGRRLRRVLHRRGGLRGAGAGRHRPDRRRPTHLRRRHHLQGRQGRQRPPRRPGRHLRHRRPRSPRRCSTPRSPAAPWPPSTSPTRSSSWPRTSAPTWSSTPAPRTRPRSCRPTAAPSVAIGLAVDDKSFATAYAGLRRGGGSCWSRSPRRARCRSRSSTPC